MLEDSKHPCDTHHTGEITALAPNAMKKRFLYDINANVPEFEASSAGSMQAVC